MLQKHQTATKLNSSIALIIWILLFMVLIYGFERWLTKQNNPNRNLMWLAYTDVIKKVTLSANRFNYYVVDGKINDQNVTFMIDTDATDVVIPANMQHNLNLIASTSLPAETVSKQVAIFTTQINKLEIGPIQLSNIRASFNFSITSNIVLLGINVLRKLELNCNQGKLILSQKS